MSGGIGLEPRGFFLLGRCSYFWLIPKAQAPPLSDAQLVTDRIPFRWRRLWTPAFQYTEFQLPVCLSLRAPLRLLPSLLGVLRAHGRSSDRPIGL